MWLRKWRMLVRVWSLIPVTELFLTCHEGILHVVDLIKRHVGGQQGELLPVCLLPSCGALVMLILTERRGTTVPEEGPAQGTCRQNVEESSQQEGTKGGETGRNREPVSAERKPTATFQRLHERVFMMSSLGLSVLDLHKKWLWIAPRLQRNGGLQHHCAKATFSNLLNTALPADLRLPHLRFPCSTITHKVCMEALWHVFASGEREEGGKSGAAAGWVTVPWAMEKGVASKRTVQDAHGLVCAKKEKKKSTMQSFIQLLTCRLGKYFSHSSIFGMMHFGSNLSILVSIQRGLS